MHHAKDTPLMMVAQGLNLMKATFKGAKDPLSNFYPCQLKIFGIEAASLEHAYQYKKAIEEGEKHLAWSILRAETGAVATK